MTKLELYLHRLKLMQATARKLKLAPKSAIKRVKLPKGDSPHQGDL